MNLLYVLVLISGVSFLYYGVTFFSNSLMKEEFDRYQLGEFRKLIGYLQLLGGVGLLVGLKYPPILTVASAGLFLLMLVGFGVRLKMKDGFLQSAPSFLFMVLNLYICIESIALQ